MNSSYTYKVKTSPPTPPNWTASLEAARTKLTPYHKIQVSPSSAEYKVLATMIGPTLPAITCIERVINPELWKKFTNTRKDLLSAKSNDLKLLAELGLSEHELHTKAHIDLNYKKGAGGVVGFGSYSDNVALLWHGSKAPLDKILSQGLDERLGNAGGTLGRGIYFADDPAKSATYDANSALLICLVYLGDCLGTGGGAGGVGMVREPEKAVIHRRNPGDLFFDSIVGRMPNEYVIFNRYHCYPMYVVCYARGGVGVNPNTMASTIYANARRQVPPFVWTATGNNYGGQNFPYPFFAQNIFDQMMDDQIQEIPGPSGYNNNTKFGRGAPAINGNKIERDEEEIALQLSTLLGLGFPDHDRNLMAIRKFGNNLEQIVDFLFDGNNNSDDGGGGQGLDLDLDGGAAGSALLTTGAANRGTAAAIVKKSGEPPTEETIASYLTSLCDLGFLEIESNKLLLAEFSYDLQKTINFLFGEEEKSLGVNAGQAPKIENPIRDAGGSSNVAAKKNTLVILPTSTVGDDDSQLEECVICAMEYLKSDQMNWKVLTCKHKLCVQCSTHLQTSARTMSGQLQSFIKCPFCQACSGGFEIGSCPNGSMTITTLLSTPASGYESFGTIQIHYVVPGTSRIGYLPNNPEGQHVVDLLRIAWDRRLIFSIGTSMTTGAQNALVWNIHHKTSLNGGIEAHGYPDSSYLTRVQAELKQYGIQ